MTGMAKVGVVRRDSMAMKPFCGYNFGDYWAHWLSFQGRVKHLPKVFHVNWFRQGPDGKFLWPGFGDNLRVIAWMLDRAAGRAQANATPIGNLPRPEDLNTQGLNVSAEALKALLNVDPALWSKEAADIRTYMQGFGSRLPKELGTQLTALEGALRN